MHNEPLSVLFVDDEQTTLRSIRRSLADAPCEVLIASGPGEALATLGARHVDVLVSDVDMPEMSGLELAQIARRDHPDTIRILLTGNATLEKAMHAINQGEVLRFFTKPFQPLAFLQELDVLESRIRELRARRNQSTREAQRRELTDWLEHYFPGSTHVERNAEGEVVLDLSHLLADIDEHRLPPAARNLLRKEG